MSPLVATTRDFDCCKLSLWRPQCKHAFCRDISQAIIIMLEGFERVRFCLGSPKYHEHFGSSKQIFIELPNNFHIEIWLYPAERAGDSGGFCVDWLTASHPSISLNIHSALWVQQRLCQFSSVQTNPVHVHWVITCGPIYCDLRGKLLRKKRSLTHVSHYFVGIFPSFLCVSFTRRGTKFDQNAKKIRTNFSPSKRFFKDKSK